MERRACRAWRWGLAATALLVASCDCTKRRDVRGVLSEATIDLNELDFGEAPVGEWRELAIRVRNRSPMEFRVYEARPISEQPSFLFEVEPGGVSPGEERIVRARFHPLEEGELVGGFVVITDADEAIDLTVRARGVGLPTPIRVSAEGLDFETLEIDSERQLELVVENPVDIPLLLAVERDEAGVFGTDVGTASPLSTQAVKVRYAPAQPGQGAGALTVRACPSCTPAAVQLEGAAVPSALVFKPSPIPFEPIPLHSQTQTTVRVTNVIWRPLDISALETSDPSFTPLTDLVARRLAPGEAVELTLQYQALSTEVNMGTLTTRYVSDKPRAVEVSLDGRSGRPQLALAPVVIEFGEIPAGGKAGRVVRLSNAGTLGPLLFQGVRGGGQADQFGVSLPRRGRTSYGWTPGTAWPALVAPDLPIDPGPDFLDVEVYFEPTAPGFYSGTISFVSDDLLHPERAVTVQGQARPAGPCAFRLLPQPAIDFGNVPLGWGAVLGFRIENAGQAECAVKNVHLSNDAGGAFFMPGGEIAGDNLIVDDAFSAMVAFRAPAAGTYEGELSLTVNDPSQPNPRLPVRGVAAPTCLVAAPNYVDFGPVRYDCSPIPRTTLVSNQCKTGVTVRRMWIGPGTSEQFSVVRAPSFPIRLEPGQGFEVEVAYARNVLGQHYNPLMFEVADEPTPFLVPVLAETNHEGIQIDQFTQGADGQLDVLFVISNTTTMGQYQARLRAAIRGWLDRARRQGLDLRVGVTTSGLVPRAPICTDVVNGGEAGRLFPVDGARPRYVSISTAGAEELLERNVEVGACHDLVQGLETMRQALSPPLSDRGDDPRTSLPNDANGGFLRGGAQLAVVAVSDEDDHSGFPPESYAQFVNSLKGLTMSHRTAVYAIVPDGSCRTAGAPGPRYATVARATGGEVLSICRSDYGELLDRIAAQAGRRQNAFRLAFQAIGPAEMTVSVDRQPASTSDWTYDSRSNSVVFTSRVPAPGQRIEIRYRSVCVTQP